MVAIGLSQVSIGKGDSWIVSVLMLYQH